MPIWRFFCCYFRRLLANTAIKQGCKKESWILLKCILSLVLFSVTLVFTAALHAHGGGDLVISLSIIFIRKAYSCCRCDSEHSAIGTMFCFSENAAYCWESLNCIGGKKPLDIVGTTVLKWGPTGGRIHSTILNKAQPQLFKNVATCYHTVGAALWRPARAELLNEVGLARSWGDHSTTLWHLSRRVR